MGETKFSGNSISAPLRDAERQIGIALARLGALGPGSNKAWVGALCEYKKLAGLLLKTRALAEQIERHEYRKLNSNKR
jgi:hypothetical protein